MSLFDLFRRFFEPPGRRDPFFGGMTLEEEEEDEDEDDFFRPSGHGFQSPFGHRQTPFHDPFGFDAFFRDFNELFADFGSMIRDVPHLPGIEPPIQSPEGSRGGSLRDSMLKYPDSHLPRDQTPYPQGPSNREGPRSPGWLPWGNNRWEDSPVVVPPGDAKQDKILDSEVSSHGLDSILSPRRPTSSSFFRSVSVSKVTRPDGTVEERRTVQDGQGNSSTTVTVTRDGQVISSGTIEPSRGSLIDFLDPRSD
ncbi:HCLS1-associated protein X-1 isoform X2 [Mixophyes fleayi]|uniref:HCLS1-associated protein X-1 isoform X2 n=1 Tax=Mixophyes fleayi TaxID=3061075 RepID=UPI003F4E3716